MTALTQPRSSTRREDELCRENLPLVGYLVNELIGRLPAHVSRDELTSAGLAALAQAARSYDDSRGVPFGRFASTRIRGALIDELRSYDWASRSVRSRARKRDVAEEQLTALLGRTPTLQEVADHLGVAPEEIGAVEEDVQRAVVLSLQGFSDSGSLDEVVAVHEPAPDEVVLHREKVGYLYDAVEVLPDRLKTVVLRYFFEERPMLEIATELGVSESRVSQMRAEALALLKDGLNAQLEPSLVTQHERPNGCAARRREAYFAEVAARGDYRTRLSAQVPSYASTAYARVASA
ncbi:RNA polymerase sigma factor for flagellar operon FliA [Motilibacter peucedani]|uniref:RNA polymerase sigma factor for flagellar operon FliA n=1 Tax=Motilibacter peucedani TaxID=598650 RepID=A0A420XTU2_9ACTN|nr:sigma-70 family RNA polymerase sigma factor [Motilibacter peucedani]RKS80170.1 RNA polymerase sigma factor for flagellar operon FliA [Motilibacter peucedani]